MDTVSPASAEHLLKDAAPHPLGAGADADRAVDRLLEAMAADVMATQPAGPRLAAVIALKRRRRGMVGVTAAAGVVLALTAATAVTVWRSTAAPDFAKSVARYVEQAPLPPGTDRAAYVELLRVQGTEHPGSVTDAGVRGSVGYYASCAWLTSWEARHEAGDAAGEAQALSAYRDAIRSPWLSEVDAGGVVANLEEVADAAARGDQGRVAQELDVNCDGLPLGGVQ